MRRVVFERVQEDFFGVYSFAREKMKQFTYANLPETAAKQGHMRIKSRLLCINLNVLLWIFIMRRRAHSRQPPFLRTFVCFGILTNGNLFQRTLVRLLKLCSPNKRLFVEQPFGLHNNFTGNYLHLSYWQMEKIGKQTNVCSANKCSWKKVP